MSLIFGSLLLDLLFLAAGLLAVLHVYIKSAHNYWKKRNVPYIEPKSPLGNLTDIILMKKPIGVVFADMYKKLEGERFGGMFTLTRPRLMFRDPELIKNVLVKDFAHFHDRGIYTNEELEPLTGHLVRLSGSRWRNLRHKLTPTFTSGKMKMMFQTLVDCGSDLTRCLQESANKGDTIEFKDILARFTTDIIASCAFGIQCNCLKNPDAEFRQWGRKIFTPTLKTSLRNILMGAFPALLKMFHIRTIDSEVSKYFINMVRETIEYRERNHIQRNDFLQLLIQLKNKGKVDPDRESKEVNDYVNDSTASSEGLSMNSVAAQAFVFFIAGFETSSTTMMFCLYELAVNPDIQDRLRAEIHSVIKKHDGKITYDSITEMNYLDRVVNETLRKYPPVPMLNRICTKQYRVPDSDVVLDERTPIVIPVMALHHDPKHYPDPTRFDPERFSDKEKEKRHPYVFLPFGEGPRICIGNRFGLMQTKVGLVSLLSSYEFEVGTKTPVPLVLDKKSVILSPLGGMWLKIKNVSNRG